MPNQNVPIQNVPCRAAENVPCVPCRAGATLLGANPFTPKDEIISIIINTQAQGCVQTNLAIPIQSEIDIGPKLHENLGTHRTKARV